MEVSVVIATHNQAERLRLVLCGLEQQSLERVAFEVIVVDDGCTDDTQRVLSEAPLANLRALSLPDRQGRCRARNAGIEAGRGGLVVFLDGDALPAPDLLERYLQAHRQHGDRVILCGFQYSLPDLEFFQDPATGALMQVAMPSILKDYLDAHREEMVLTEDMVRSNFEAIRARAHEGGYPFAELKERQEQVREMLEERPAAACAWLGLVPHNAAVPRALLEEVGGFDEQIPFSEGWELAYRMQCDGGARFAAVQADSFHLYHHRDFADPEEQHVRYRAIEHMVCRHREVRIRLLYFWLASIWPDRYIPEEARIGDLLEFDRLYRELTEAEWREYALVLLRHPVISHLLRAEVTYENCT